MLIYGGIGLVALFILVLAFPGPMKTIEGFIKPVLVFVLIVYTVLFSLRGVGPSLHLCEVRGKGTSQTTQCFDKIITFRGDDWLSILNLKFSSPFRKDRLPF
ncbi:MAG: hypothetical protein EOP06_03580 [Proteobacteria bacterium]|nr:MAG: hypothetical protein EOP06_03580 [Pseudomonadota bacterium]